MSPYQFFCKRGIHGCEVVQGLTKLNGLTHAVVGGNCVRSEGVKQSSSDEIRGLFNFWLFFDINHPLFAFVATMLKIKCLLDTFKCY